jgi:precorrin-4 methylase
MEESIMHTKIDVLMKAMNWFRDELKKTNKTSQKIADFEKLKRLEEQSIIPDHDHIDRLMRYQTTLQIQLSTAIGELIALTKTP